jgi:hypothetical protein
MTNTTSVDIDAEDNYITCRRCLVIAQAGDTTCANCGITFGPAVVCDVTTRIQLIDAMASLDYEHIVRLALAAHADGLLEVAS